MEVTYHLTNIAIGGVSVTMSYWVEKMQLSFCLFIKSARQFKWYTKTLDVMGWKCMDNKFQVLTNT